jgi:hypothetical protein
VPHSPADALFRIHWEDSEIVANLVCRLTRQLDLDVLLGRCTRRSEQPRIDNRCLADILAESRGARGGKTDSEAVREHIIAAIRIFLASATGAVPCLQGGPKHLVFPLLKVGEHVSVSHIGQANLADT